MGARDESERSRGRRARRAGSLASSRACARPPAYLLLASRGTTQGGLDERLREISLQGLVARDTPGYAIGGLAGGEDKRSFVK